MKVSKAGCCCSMGKAWGPDCELCPAPRSRQYRKLCLEAGFLVNGTGKNKLSRQYCPPQCTYLFLYTMAFSSFPRDARSFHQFHVRNPMEDYFLFFLIIFFFLLCFLFRPVQTLMNAPRFLGCAKMGDVSIQWDLTNARATEDMSGMRARQSA